MRAKLFRRDGAKPVCDAELEIRGDAVRGAPFEARIEAAHAHLVVEFEGGVVFMTEDGTRYEGGVQHAFHAPGHGALLQGVLTRIRAPASPSRPSMMMDSLSEIRPSPLGPEDRAPQFVEARVQQEPPVLQLTYAAQRAPDETDGRSLILSLFKRMQMEMGAQYHWPVVAVFFPAAHGEAPDSNYRLAVEAMTAFCLPLKRAFECTHFDGTAYELGYELANAALFPLKSAACLYQPTASTWKIRFRT